MGATPVDLLVLLHGFEDAPERLGTAAAAALDAATSGWVPVTPRGPFEAPAGPSWFGDDGLATPEHVTAARDALTTALDEARTTHGPVGRLVLAGFSQGGALALAATYGTQRPEGPAITAAACLGGFLLPPDDVDYDWPATADRPALLVHGIDDDVVPVQQARAGARALERRGVPVTLHEVATAHDVDLTLLTPMPGWLATL